MRNATRLVCERLQRPPGGGGGVSVADKQEEIDGKQKKLLRVVGVCVVSCNLQVFLPENLPFLPDVRCLLEVNLSDEKLSHCFSAQDMN